MWGGWGLGGGGRFEEPKRQEGFRVSHSRVVMSCWGGVERENNMGWVKRVGVAGGWWH